MHSRLSLIISGLVLSVACCLCGGTEVAHAGWFSLLPSEIPETPFEEWTVREGDGFIVDTSTNIGYLIHQKGGYTSFAVATGQKRIVHYIGRTYNATTPARHWTALSNERKGDSITFGKEGVFLRLSYDGEETSYGIHTHAYIEAMLARQERYRSMGCILVAKEVLNVLEETFAVNNDKIDVVTIDGFGDESINYVSLLEHLKENSTEEQSS